MTEPAASGGADATRPGPDAPKAADGARGAIGGDGGTHGGGADLIGSPAVSAAVGMSTDGKTLPPPGARRVRPVAVVAACLRRDAAEAWSYRLPFLWRFVEMFSALFMLYFLGHLVGDRIVTVTGSSLTGGYFGYAVIGTGLVAILHGAITTFANRLRADQTTGTLEAMLATPTPAWLTVVAGSTYGLLQIIVVELVTLGLAVGLFGLRFNSTPTGILILVPGFVATVACFVAIGLLVAAFTMVFKRGQALGTVIISVFTLLGGVYYPVSLLPRFLRSIGDLLPFTWGLDLIRGSLVFGTTDLAQLGGLTACDAVLVPVAIWAFGIAVDRTRRTGTLGQY